MQVDINNYRSIVSAQIECGHITLLGGRHGAGKSSILSAVAACLSGSPLPAAIKKKDAGILIRDGESIGGAMVWGEGWASRVSWPRAEVTSDGLPPPLSPVAAGIEHPIVMDAVTRARFFAHMLKSEPTETDLRQHLLQAGFGEHRAHVIDAAWKVVEAQGWDGAHTKMVEANRTKKGQWKEVAGKTYGSQQGQSWRPDGWRITWESGDMTDIARGAALNDAVKDAQTKHERAVAAAAVDLDARGRHREAADRLPEIRAALQKAEEALTVARAARNALPPANVDVTVPCPCCGEPLVVRGKELRRPTAQISHAELNLRRDAIAAADGIIAGLRAAEGQARAALAASEESGKWLADHPPRLGPGVDQDPVQTKADLAAAESAQDLWKRYSRARILHRDIVETQHIIDALAPEGLRKSKMASAVQTFNGGILLPICETAAWQAVELTEDLMVTYGGRPYAICSASEQYRARVVLQIAVAQLDGSCLVLIDGIEILLGQERTGLILTLSAALRDSIITLSAPGPHKLPDLSRINGASYWIADGGAQPRDTAIAAFDAARKTAPDDERSTPHD